MATRRPWMRMLRPLRNNSKNKTAQPPRRWSIVKGDTVEIINGPEQGKRGKVLRKVMDRGTLLVEGVRMVRRMVPPTKENPDGGMYQFETPVHVSSVSLIDPIDNKPTKVRFEKDENGKRAIRISKRSGKEIEKPKWVRDDLPDREKYQEMPWDTRAQPFAEQTYTPTVLSFDEEVIKACCPSVQLNSSAAATAAKVSSN
eukprot:m.683116 g.683116  ORF g.683116 m.683116 type:complete len:200 (+) comp22827_c1_seq8:274-873(+)